MWRGRADPLRTSCRRHRRCSRWRTRRPKSCHSPSKGLLLLLLPQPVSEARWSSSSYLRRGPCSRFSRSHPILSCSDESNSDPGRDRLMFDCSSEGERLRRWRIWRDTSCCTLGIPGKIEMVQLLRWDLKWRECILARGQFRIASGLRQASSQLCSHRRSSSVLGSLLSRCCWERDWRSLEGAGQEMYLVPLRWSSDIGRSSEPRSSLVFRTRIGMWNWTWPRCWWVLAGLVGIWLE